MHLLSLFILLMITFPALARVTIEEKISRVDFIERIAVVAPWVSIEAYQRELEYERQGLDLEHRARNEANLLAEKIKTQIISAYEVAYNEHGNHEDAKTEITQAILKDLQLAGAGFREELMDLALTTLSQLSNGTYSIEFSLSNLEKTLLEQVKERSFYLNQSDLLETASLDSIQSDKIKKYDYDTRQELVSALVAQRESAPWVSTANMTMRTAKTKEVAGKISLQVKIEFMGVGIEAGPSINFKREYTTQANIMAEGLNPILLNDGNFDFHKRDTSGNIIYLNEVPQRRFMTFYCESELSFQNDITTAGGFKVAGVGGDSSVSQVYKNSVTLASRRVYVPEYVTNKSVTVKFISELCHKEFLGAQINNRMTVSDSLNIMMRNLVSGLTYSHPKTKCAIDSHCFDWYNREVLGLFKLSNYPRCVEESREKYRSCELRGLQGQNCGLYDKKGERISDGMFEFKCDVGLRCTQVQKGGWFTNGNLYQYAKGKCLPVNPSTYRSPFQK